MKQSLKDRLLAYLRRISPGWTASGDLQRLVATETTYSPQNTGRRLRELVNEGEIEVEYRKGHAHYRARQKDPVPVPLFNV